MVRITASAEGAKRHILYLPPCPITVHDPASAKRAAEWVYARTLEAINASLALGADDGK